MEIYSSDLGEKTILKISKPEAAKLRNFLELQLEG